jgi:hypothetical protein
MPTIKSRNAVEGLSWRVCAARLDPNVSAEDFVTLVDRLIEAAREEGRKERESTGDRT